MMTLLFLDRATMDTGPRDAAARRYSPRHHEPGTTVPHQWKYVISPEGMTNAPEYHRGISRGSVRPGHLIDINDSRP